MPSESKLFLYTQHKANCPLMRSMIVYLAVLVMGRIGAPLLLLHCMAAPLRSTDRCKIYSAFTLHILAEFQVRKSSAHHTSTVG